MTTTIHMDYDAILAAICAEPLDLYHRLAMYDYWEERGDTLRLRAWRALEGKFPNAGPRSDGSGVVYWWYGGKRTWSRYPATCVIDPVDWVRNTQDDFDDEPGARLLCFYRMLQAFTNLIEGYVRWKQGESNALALERVG